MGYETYLVEIRLKDIGNKDDFVQALIENNFILTKSNNNLYLEKTYSSGIVEICISQTQIAFRYAKPNLKNSLLVFLEELQDISVKYEFELFDFYSKKTYEREQFLDILDYFEKSRNEFAEYYLIDTFPVKSQDVFKKTK